MMRRLFVVVLVIFALATSLQCAAGAEAFKHGWGTVAESIGMHGHYADTPTQADVEFVAKNYAFCTTRPTSCKDVTSTIEADTLAFARRVKAVNASTLVGMYWRSPNALEMAQCSGFSAEWNAHPEWRLKDDNGKDIAKGPNDYYIDYVNADAAAFFAKVLINVTTFKLTSGKPVIDYIYIDSPPKQPNTIVYQPGINPERSMALVKANYATFASIQNQLDANGFNQKVVLNSMDTPWEAAAHVATGAAGTMFDHWSILQFINRTTGTFNVTAMEEGIALANDTIFNNVTLQIKGWPGPIKAQRDVVPPALPQPKTPKDFQKVAAERFNSELALFLLVADEYDFWVYSWFWEFLDFVPGHSASTVPAEYYPQANCPLGAPKTGAMFGAADGTFTREFEQASVYVDLNNRTASKVDFANC